MPRDVSVFPADPAATGLAAAVHRIIHAVAAEGGAIGFSTPPDQSHTDRWLADLLAATTAGDAALMLATVAARIEGLGCWRRSTAGPFRGTADLQKIMAHPDARGLGLGRLITGALIEDARRHQLETLTLGVRGNNHGARQLYEEFGFQVWGTLPNVIAVGADRFDDVRMYLPLGYPAGTQLRGSSAGGPGSSPGRPG